MAVSFAKLAGWKMLTIVDHHRHVATDETQVVVAVTVKLLDHVVIQLHQERLIERLYSDDNILHPLIRILLLEDLEHLVRVGYAVTVSPLRPRKLVAAMIETVL